ncbi:serine/threonine-protein kinase [Streptomyces sp. NBC_01186]|uniref:serine/threonine-protein kinase n=1 Tax=Streptomyces sp. NBC_01186 TaxID=2903765 RepID=UPI002E0FD105|nr:serine/threonine-protein kinase [Streptomyces sp. NBC_01186]
MDEATARLDLPAGYRVGEWTLTDRLGAGSWGVVYAAEDEAGGPAAVKFLPTHLLPPGQREAMEQLVQREVRFSLEADHPNVVRTRAALTLHDPDRPELEGVTALVMDRAENSLQELLTGGSTGSGGSGPTGSGSTGPVPEAARVLAGVAAGLAHIHERGWVHGDLKPGNVLLAPEGRVWLADFGLTAELDGTHAYVPPLGSLDHVPPEWWSDREGGRSVVRPTADIWAFGVLAHQVLTGGAHPFPGGTARARALAAQAYARGSAELRLDNGVPAPWRELIADCLRPDHGSRAALGAAELAARAGALRDRPPTGEEGRPGEDAGGDTAGEGAGPEGAGPEGAGPQSSGARRRRLAVLAAAIGVPVVGAAAVAGALLGDGTAAPESKPESKATASSSPVAGALPAKSDVPRSLRPTITRAARLCADEEVTPALLAAMLKAESGFDAKAKRPETDEYGIAMWTPSVFKGWAADGDHDGDKDYMSPPDAISAMSNYVCWMDQQFKKKGLREDLPGFMAAGYRTSSRTVIEERGVPERLRPHVNRVKRYLKEYSR